MILIPIGDDNDEGHAHHHEDFIHWGLIFACLLVFGYETYLICQGIDKLDAFVDRWSFDPRVYLGSNFLSLGYGGRVVMLLKCLGHLGNMGAVRMVTHAFIHGSPLHLFGNLFILWMLGDNVEFAMGHWRYLFFFIFMAMFSEFGSIIFSTNANFMPGIGASGAIMAVAGAYIFYFPKAHINIFYNIMLVYWGIFGVPAWLFLGLMGVGDLVTAYNEYGTNYGMVGVTAHASGFVMGILLAYPLRKNKKEPLYRRGERVPYNKSLAETLRQRREKAARGEAAEETSIDRWDDK